MRINWTVNDIATPPMGGLALFTEFGVGHNQVVEGL